MDAYAEQTGKILEAYSLGLSNMLARGEDANIYYKNGGDTVNVLTVIKNDEDSGFLGRIYSAQAKIIQRYILGSKEENVSINFRVLPTYNNPISSIIPSSFKRYNAKTRV